MQRFMLLDHHRLMIRPLLTKCDFHICNHHNRYHYHLYQSIHSKHHHNNHVLETKNNLFIAKSSFFTHSKWRFASKIENDLSKLNSPKTTSPLTEDIRSLY